MSKSPGWSAHGSIRRGERYVTHPLLFVGALGVGVVLIAAGMLFSELWEFSLLVAVLVAAGLVFGSLSFWASPAAISPAWW